MNEDDLAHARRVWEQLADAAAGIAQRLVKSCRENDGDTAALIATQLQTAPDANLAMLVLGQLTTRLVAAERRASETHGPLATPEDMGISADELVPTPWQSAVADQLDAAAKDNDYRLYARTAVDNQIKCIYIDREGGNNHDWEAMFRGMLLVDHQTLVVLATEMLHRLAGDTP